MTLDVEARFSRPVPRWPINGRDWNLLVLVDGSYFDLAVGWPLPLASDWEASVNVRAPAWTTWGIYQGQLSADRRHFTGRPLCGSGARP